MALDIQLTQHLGGHVARAQPRGGPLSWRHQVPVRSPLSAAALLAGARAAMGNGRSAAAVERVTALLRGRYAPQAVLLTDGGTTALRAALVGALQDRPGAAVALPAFSCYDLATAAIGAGVPVVCYDIDPQSLAPDLASLRAALRLSLPCWRRAAAASRKR